jgi:hypothetical protein
MKDCFSYIKDSLQCTIIKKYTKTKINIIYNLKMKKFFLPSIVVLPTSFKHYGADSGLIFDYELKYKMPQ